MNGILIQSNRLITMDSKDCPCAESWDTSPPAVVVFEVDMEPTNSKPSSWLTCWLREVMDDLRSTRWRQFAHGYLIAFWFFLLLILTADLLIYLFMVSQNFLAPLQRYPGCLPNDVFNARSNKFNIFAWSSLFQITHGFGALTFTQAKMIDVIWDVVMGRAGQGILAFFSWKAFSAYYKKCLNTTSVTYDTFWTVFLDRQSTVFSLWHMIQSFTHQRRRKSKGATAFIILNILFVVAFPTIMSAMTGYRPNTAAFVTDTDSILIPFERFIVVAYVIHDGNRIGLGAGHIVPFISPLVGNDANMDLLYALDNYPKSAPSLCRELVSEDCELSRSVSLYVKQYGFFGLDSKTGGILNADTRWMNETLTKPALNISAFYLPPAYDNDHAASWYGHDWVDPRTNTTPFSDPSNMRMFPAGSNTMYPIQYVEQNGSCQQQNTYQWGFSFLQVFITSILLLVWSCGTYLMWLGSTITLAHRNDEEVPTKYKAALTFVAALNSQLGGFGKEPASLTNQQLETAIKNELVGGSILTETTAISVPDYNIFRGIWEWVKSYPIWFFMILTTTVFISTWVAFPDMYLLCGQPFQIPFHTGMIFAVVVGRTKRSRFFFALVGLFITLVFVATMQAMMWVVA